MIPELHDLADNSSNDIFLQLEVYTNYAWRCNADRQRASWLLS
jgi:hypothetical protein